MNETDDLGTASATGRWGQFGVDFLAFSAACAFAIAQPLYSVLGQNPEFFVAHQMGGGGLLLFVATLSLAVPLALAAVGAALDMLAPLARKIWLAGVTGLLVGTALLPFLWRVIPDNFAIAAAAVLTFAAAIFAFRLRSFLAFASPIALAFPLLFLIFSPAAAIFATGSPTISAASMGAAPPIVMLVFDEFNLTALLDENEEIDPVRFPNLAALAETATWYRRALTVDDQTRRAVPAILTGIEPGNEPKLPTAAGHPDNIFSWLNGAYKINGVELITQLCPPGVCSTQESSTISDTAIVYLHEVLPRSVASRFLPQINAGWANFAGDDAAAMNFRDRVRHTRVVGRAATLENFIDSISTDDGTLNFLHVMLPHRRWEYASSGKLYTAPTTLRGLEEEVWATDSRGRSIAFLRMLLQMGYIDSAIGKLRTHLEASGRFDETMIVLVADHGIAFEPNEPARKVTPANAASILRVPLVIKYPGQSQGQISDIDARTVDIVPTIADVLQTDLPWSATGTSLRTKPFPSRDQVRVVGDGKKRGPQEFEVSSLFDRRQLEWQNSVFGSSKPLSTTVVLGSAPGIVGKRLDDLSLGSEISDLVVQIDGKQLYQQVGLGQIPLYLSGRLTKGDGTPDALDRVLGIELNGVIVATVETLRLGDGSSAFELMLPEDSLTEGHNVLRAYAIEGDQVRPLSEGGDYRLVPYGNDQMTVSDGETVLKLTPDIEGVFVYQLDSTSLDLQGWAVDTSKNAPAQSMLIFENGKLVFSTVLSRRSKSVAKRFGFSEEQPSNFRHSMPKDAFDPESADLRIFVLSDGRAKELSACKGRSGRWC